MCMYLYIYIYIYAYTHIGDCESKSGGKGFICLFNAIGTPAYSTICLFNPMPIQRYAYSTL